jgi:hypothetical protein
VTVLILVVCGSLLGLWLALEGLHLRLFGDMLSLIGASGLFWRILASLSIEPLAVAWPLITIGTAWAGVVCGILIRLGGIQRFVWILGLISMLFLLPGTVLGLIVLISLWAPPTRAWLAAVGTDVAA